MDSYEISGNELAYCHGIWDPQTRTYKHSTDLDVVNCCVQACQGYISYCFQQCHNNYGPESANASYRAHEKCHRQCRQLITNCENDCLDYPIALSDLVTCAEISNCSTYPDLDTECLDKNRETIVACCKKQCPHCDKDCDQYWHQLRSGSPLHSYALEYDISRTQFRDNNNKQPVLYVVYILFIILTLLGIYLLRK